MLLLKGVIPFYFLTACTRTDDGIALQWEQGRATGIAVPTQYLTQVPGDSVSALLTIHLADTAGRPAILGEFISENDRIVFMPLVAFTPGLVYEVRLRNKVLAHIEVPLPDSKNAAQVLAIYPTQDTLPHNVLKIYIRFSRAMSEGRSLEHITLLKNGRDTVHGAFLDLKPELWDGDRSTLTLWLDPGRIKRDLQPNKMLGEPLQRGEHYELVIDSKWVDTNGSFLMRPFSKKFMVANRDSLAPDVDKWAIKTPNAETTEPLILDLHEPLDYTLLNEAVWITDQSGNPLAATLTTEREESLLKFTPGVKWIAGTYTIHCESRLEDLAGNNLNSPFDRDITTTSADNTKKIFTREFVIK